MTVTLEIKGKVLWGVRKSPIWHVCVCKGAGTANTIDCLETERCSIGKTCRNVMERVWI